MNEKPEKQPIRVLIVEDDRDFAFLIEKLLRRQEDIRIAGHCAEQAEVLEAVREAKPDVVLMDLNLGKSSADGIGLSREIRIQTDAKVLILTAINTPDMIIAGHDYAGGQRGLCLGLCVQESAVPAGGEHPGCREGVYGAGISDRLLGPVGAVGRRDGRIPDYDGKGK